MTLLRVCLHSFVLTITDLGSIILAFGFYSLLRSIMSVNQRVVQGSIAAIFCIIIFSLWSLVVTLALVIAVYAVYFRPFA